MKKEKQIQCDLFGEKCKKPMRGVCGGCPEGSENIKEKLRVWADLVGIQEESDLTIIVGPKNLTEPSLSGRLINENGDELIRITVEKGKGSIFTKRGS